MQDLLHRLYRAKLALLATGAIVAGASLLFLAHTADANPGWHWLSNLPVTDVGSALFTSGLVIIFFEYLGKQDEERRTLLLLRHVLKQAAPDIRDAVVDGFAFAPDSLTDVASPETLDRVIENCLGLQLGDAELARDAYADLREQVVRAPERRQDVRTTVTLSPWEHGKEKGAGSMFVATIRWEYRVTRPTSKTMRFSCVSDLDEYRELSQDPTSTEVWYFQPVASYDASSPEVFELLECTVNGKACPARRASRRGSQIYTVTLENEEADEMTVAYTYRALVQRHGHLLYLELAQPTKGFAVQFNYGRCGIRYVSVRDSIAGAGQPRIAQLPATDAAPSIEVRYDGWVFPKGGVAFVWVLEDEIGRRTQRRSLSRFEPK